VAANSDSNDKLGVALRQLEHAEDYLQAAASVLPELEDHIDRMLDDVEALRQDLTRRRLAG
jgi:hypothetical protein